MDNNQVFDIVFEGGGAKGLAHVGAMHEFTERGYKEARLVGTSAGAMTAGLLAAGFSPKELQTAAFEKLPDGRPVFSGFMDVPASFSPEIVKDSWLGCVMESIDLPFIPNSLNHLIEEKLTKLLLESSHCREAFSLLECGGLYSGDTMDDWLHTKLDSKNGMGDATFSEFASETGSDLTVLATDTIGEEMLVLNHRTTPDCPVAWAIRMSMNLPLVWQEVLWKKEWGFYKGADITGHSIIDGGLISNFALDLLVSDSPEVHAVMGKPSGNRVFGLLLDGDLAVPGAPARDTKPEGKLALDLMHSKTFGRITRTLDTITGANDLFVMSGYEEDVCHLPVKGYGTTEFDMSEDRINALIAAGKSAATSYFENRNLATEG